MKVELKTILAGPQGNGKAGEVIDVDDDFGKNLISGGFATEVKPAEVDSMAELEEKADLEAEKSRMDLIKEADDAAESEEAQLDLGETASVEPKQNAMKKNPRKPKKADSE